MPDDMAKAADWEELERIEYELFAAGFEQSHRPDNGFPNEDIRRYQLRWRRPKEPVPWREHLVMFLHRHGIHAMLVLEDSPITVVWTQDWEWFIETWVMVTGHELHVWQSSDDVDDCPTCPPGCLKQELIRIPLAKRDVDNDQVRSVWASRDKGSNKIPYALHAVEGSDLVGIGVGPELSDPLAATPLTRDHCESLVKDLLTAIAAPHSEKDPHV